MRRRRMVVAFDQVGDHTLTEERDRRRQAGTETDRVTGRVIRREVPVKRAMSEPACILSRHHSTVLVFAPMGVLLFDTAEAVFHKAGLAADTERHCTGWYRTLGSFYAKHT